MWTHFGWITATKSQQSDLLLPAKLAGSVSVEQTSLDTLIRREIVFFHRNIDWPLGPAAGTHQHVIRAKL